MDKNRPVYFSPWPLNKLAYDPFFNKGERWPPESEEIKKINKVDWRDVEIGLLAD